MGFEYPAHPHTNHRNPLRDEAGVNPFADEQVAAPATDNPYAASAEAGAGYQPVQYEQTLPHRGPSVFRFGLSGFVCSALGAGVLVGFLLVPDAVEGTWLSLAGCLLVAGVIASWIAWMRGRDDLRAIWSGAMDPAGSRATRFGHALGLAGTVIATVPLIAGLWRIVQAAAEAF